MISMLTNRLLFRREKKPAVLSKAPETNGKPDKTIELGIQAGTQVSKQRRIPEWEEVLTASLKENSLAPADEVILHAFDLFCDEMNAPFDERQHRMNEHFSRIAAGFARVQSLAPDMVERAAAKHRLELDRFIEGKRTS